MEGEFASIQLFERSVLNPLLGLQFKPTIHQPRLFKSPEPNIPRLTQAFSTLLINLT